MGKIWHWLGRPGNPEGLLEVKEIFDKFYPSIYSSLQISGGNVNDEGNSSRQENENTDTVLHATSVIPSELCPLLGTQYEASCFKEVIFSTSRCHLGNSQIVQEVMLLPDGKVTPFYCMSKYQQKYSD